MKYLPYFLIVLLVIVLVFAVLKLTTGRDRGKRKAVEAKISKAILEEMGMKVEKMEDLEEQGVNLRLLAIEAELDDNRRRQILKESTKESTEYLVKFLYEYILGKFERALALEGLDPGAIDELSNEELREIYESFQRKARRYCNKFSCDSITDEVTEASIFTYEDDGKLSLSISRAEMNSEQREHLKLLERHLEKHLERVKGIHSSFGNPVKIIVHSDEEAVRITYDEKVPDGILTGDFIMQFIIDRETGTVVSISFGS